MERLRLPRLLAAAVVVGCCARLCPGLSTEMGPTPATAVPCAHPDTATGARCPTDPERGADMGQAPTLEAVGQLRAAAELLPFPGTPTAAAGTPTGAAETPGPQQSPGGSWSGRDGAATEQPGPRLPVGSESLGGTLSAGAPAPEEPDTAPATGHSPWTGPAGNVVSEGATTSLGTPSYSPSTAVPGGQGGSPSTLLGWSPMGTALVQSRGGSHGPSSPEPGAGEDAGATVPLGDRGPGPRPSTALATDSPAPGTSGTSPFAGGLQSLLTPTGTPRGTLGGTLGLAGGRGSSHGMDISWQGPGAAPHSSAPFLGAGDPASSTAVGPGPASLPAAGTGPGLPVPTSTASTPGVTPSGPGGPLDPTPGLSGAPDIEGPPGHSHVPLHQTWPPGQLLTSMAPGSAVQSQGLVTSPGTPPAPSAAPASGSVVPTTPLPSPGTRWGVWGLSPTAGTPSPPVHHSGSGGDPAETPQIPGGDSVGVGDAGSWAVTDPPSWEPGSLDTPSAPGTPRPPAPSQPETFLRPTTAIGTTTTAVTTTTTTASPALLGDVGTITPKPSAAVLQRDVVGLTWGPPIHLPTKMPGPPQQPTDPPGTLGHGGGPGSPPGAGDTDLVQPSSDPRAQPDADTPRAPPAATGRAPRVFIVEDQPPLLRASILRVPCELVLDMGFSPALQDPASREHRALLHSFNRTVTPLFAPLPGFLRLEVTRIREGSVVLEYDALFTAEHVQAPGLGAMLNATLGSGSARPGLAMGTASILRHAALELEPCAALFTCRAGFACVAGADGNTTCTSLCHRGYCKNHGICTHPRDRGPLCQCPVGSDFWFMGLRCDYRVTQQSLLGMAAGVLLSILLLGAVIAAVAVRRFKVLLMEARADQTRSSYRRFCRLDDVSAQYWSRSWLPSASSLDNPAFSNSEELLHLQALDNGCCGCREDSGIAAGAKQRPAPGRASFHYEWDTSSGSMNDPMVDSGKASDISVSSWPMEPIQWTPFPLLHQLSRQRPHKARRPHSYCEGMELVNLERSWTA
ncbi:collagen alpha-1(I) chain-like isoform X2 [Strigops habroptila]|uniref:collagen alpha-1(I) chain-like isoform X2 n=1 Tax=Strigops habroptila TaxID=2489341 RepID=UPI0011CF48E4|nr:collagen alpha-1(I) chain-like isoform X2 [Strigops habroptila]